VFWTFLHTASYSRLLHNVVESGGSQWGLSIASGSKKSRGIAREFYRSKILCSPCCRLPPFLRNTDFSGTNRWIGQWRLTWRRSATRGGLNVHSTSTCPIDRLLITVCRVCELSYLQLALRRLPW